MTPTQILVIVALTVYAIYKQSVAHPVNGKSRFKLAIIYCIVGLISGGFYLPPSGLSWTILLGSLLLSAVVGVARGRLSKMWIAADDQVMVRGTPLTITLFVLLIAAKFAIGAWQYMTHQPGEHGGFGEVLLLIGVMVALQAEVVWRRALALRGAPLSESAAGQPS
ncbi:MAG: hypothetical protein ABWZ88_10515 [Variovorax sp.]